LEYLADFHFVITYQPGIQGTKPDALTRQPDVRPATKGSSLLMLENPGNLQQLLEPGQYLGAALSELKISLDLKSLLLSSMKLDKEATTLMAKAVEPTENTIFKLDTNGLLQHPDEYYVPCVNNLQLFYH
jgi:hypothetical protein